MNLGEKIEGNQDLLTKIPVLLPVFRFKTVSRRWNSLISAHHFSKQWKPTVAGLLVRQEGFRSKRMYEYIPLSSSSVCWYYPQTSTSWKVIDYTDADSGVAMLDSVGSLFMCSFKTSAYWRGYYICNHMTKQFTRLPDPARQPWITGGIVETMDRSDGMTLAYDLSKYPHYELIVVRRTNSYRDYMLKVQIYSSHTKCWAPWGPDFKFPFRIKIYFGAFLNNVVYWPSNKSELLSIHYDIDGQSFHSFPMPPFPEGNSSRDIKYFRETKGCLVMIMCTSEYCPLKEFSLAS